jgi:hypothetical protein
MACARFHPCCRIEVSRTSTVAQTARERLEADELKTESEARLRNEGLRKRMEKQVTTQAANQAALLNEGDRNIIKEMATIKLRKSRSQPARPANYIHVPAVRTSTTCRCEGVVEICPNNQAGLSVCHCSPER